MSQRMRSPAILGPVSAAANHTTSSLAPRFIAKPFKGSAPVRTQVGAHYESTWSHHQAMDAMGGASVLGSLGTSVNVTPQVDFMEEVAVDPIGWA